MSEELDLDWQEDDPENLLADFDIDEWLKTGNTDSPNIPNIKNTSTDMSTNSNNNSNNNNNINTTETPKQFKCPLCNEICDTYKALEVHCNECCSKPANKHNKIYKCCICNKSFNSQTKYNNHLNICIQQKKRQKEEQKKWQNILNMNNKKRSRNNSKDNIIFSVPSKKRKTNTSPKITKMRKKNKKSNNNNKTKLTQKTLEDVVPSKFFVKVKTSSISKPCQKLKKSNNSALKSQNTIEKKNNSQVTPGYDIDLFPRDKDCMEIDEKSSQLHIKQKLKDDNVDNKSMKESFLNLNGFKVNNSKENVIISETESDNDENGNDGNKNVKEQSINSFHSTPDKMENHDLLSPYMSPNMTPIMIDGTQMEGMDENFVLTNIVNTNSSKKKRSKKSNKKKKIEFIPPWEMK